MVGVKGYVFKNPAEIAVSFTYNPDLAVVHMPPTPSVNCVSPPHYVSAFL